MAMYVNTQLSVITIGVKVFVPGQPMEIGEEWLENERVQQLIKDGHLKEYHEEDKK